MSTPESESGQGDESLPLSQVRHIDQLCDQFEASLRDGQQPRIETFLTDAPDEVKSRLLQELLCLEVDWYYGLGQTTAIESLRQRFADHPQLIDMACERARLQHQVISDVSTTGPPKEGDTEIEIEEAEQIPAQIGRYEIQRELGRGGFAMVYLARDTELDRQVALKVPRRDRFRSVHDMQRFVEEARHTARMDHPGIVRVFDVQRNEQLVYIVQQYVAGQDLATALQQRRLTLPEIAQLLIGIAQAIGFAHRSSLYHRDLKPANILLDESDRPYVVDFGLAVHVAQQHRHRGELAGSYPYMAPEQVRGEVHRLDGRTDIWALGVIMYELLTGERPFNGESRTELFDEIEHRDPRPPRQIAPGIPKELSRICLACLTKLASDQYESTADLSEDLRLWLESAPAAEEQDLSATSEGPSRIVPKGLRSFDAKDADFFLELLPGPRDRDGLPKSIRFWKARIEETDPDETFSVGLIYGPSGCGKSSLVRAGLLPRLAEHVAPVYVEATASDTEVRLIKSLRRRYPELPAEAALVELFSMLRDQATAGGSKVLIVLDQFEQWLHARGADDQSQLVGALRQCDGGNLQAVVLVRDDFYRGVNRFFQALEEQLLEGQNQALVDLFDPDHAKKVLTAFGQAYGKLIPETELTHQQTAFLDAAVTGLAEKGEVISVRLAVFAEMMKGKPWTQASLREVGGTEGVGVTFLEETFAARTAPPNYRLHEKGVRAVLQALLPELGTEIKGQMVSYEQLLKRCGYADRAADFDALLAILDKEVRLITPTEPDEGGGEADQPTEQSAKHYQLSHDYLVPSLRRWLRQKETESYSGRARLRLADRASLWQRKPQNQQLPAWWEFLSILALTRKRDWSKAQRQMMSAARWYYTTRTAALTVLVSLLAWGGREISAHVNSRALVESLAAAGEDKVLEVAANLQRYLPWAEDSLNEWAAKNAKTIDDRKKQLHARLALVATGDMQVPPLVESLLTATPKYVGVIRDALSPYKEKVVATLWTEFHTEKAAADRRFRAGMALASYAPDAEQWKDDDYRFLVQQLVSSNAEHQPVYRSYLAGVATKCLPHVDSVFEKGESLELQTAAANAVAEFAADDQRRIARLLSVANPRQYEILFPLIADNPDEVGTTSLTEVAAELPPDNLSSVDRLSFGRRRAGAGITLLRLGQRESVLPTFEMTDDPEALTQFIHRCRDRGVSAEELIALLRLVSDETGVAKTGGSGGAPPNHRQHAYRREGISDPLQQSHIRHALLLALGEYSLDEIPASQRDPLLADLADWYANDPSSGVHGATGWLLRKWGQDDIVQTVDQTPVPYAPDREWFTLAITVTSPRRVYASETAEEDDEATEKHKATGKNEAAGSPDGEPTEAGEGSTDESSENDEQTTSPDKPPTNNEENGEDAPAGNAENSNDAEDGSSETEQAEQEPDFVPQTFYLTFIVFPAGEYQIGSVADEPEQDNNEARHAVRITRPFALLDRELTFAELIAFDRQYARFMRKSERNPGDAGFGADWYDAVAFCRWVTEQAGLAEEDQAYPAPDSLDKENYPREPDPDANWAPRDWPIRLDSAGFRLPTEAEWEVACRGGTRTPYAQGADVGLLRHYAWYTENSEKHVHPPKTRRPGMRGTFDLHGNLYEWCHDWYGSYAMETVDDWTGPKTGSGRVNRGGSWLYVAANCRSSNRNFFDPSDRDINLGFRVALVLSSKHAGGGQKERAEAFDPSQAEPDGL